MRMLDRGGELFGTMTPLKGLTWVYDEIYLAASPESGIFYVQAEWADNPFLDAEEVKKLTSGMSAEGLESRRYGRFRRDEGLIYTEFDLAVHVIDPVNLPPEWQSGVSIDPGLHNPLSCHFYYQDYDGNIYVAAEHYEKEKDIDYHAAEILKIADGLFWRRENGYVCALIDSAAEQKTLASVKSVAELFWERGIAVNARVNKDVWSGIQTVKGYFAARPPRIFIFRTCVNLIRELKSYWWGKGDSPVKKDDHALDELRYFLMSRPLNKPKAESKTRHQKYKETLLKRIKNS
jgi:hypothetical protein